MEFIRFVTGELGKPDTRTFQGPCARGEGVELPQASAVPVRRAIRAELSEVKFPNCGLKASIVGLSPKRRSAIDKIRDRHA
jgi:hypothetical protein